MSTLSTVLTRKKGLLMLQIHYYLIQNNSVTKRASPNLSLGLSFQPLSLLPALVRL